jgi:diguanylate cyclase (GGDEF)-like protein
MAGPSEEVHADEAEVGLWGRVMAIARSPFRSLPSRIILSVFGAALAASMAVALVSTLSIESFLSLEIDQKFPATLLSASERLDLWYAQRRLDIETFARSATVIENAQRMSERGTSERARAELSQYLTYVLDRFPQYEALLLLDPNGEQALWVGPDVDLPAGLVLGLAHVAVSAVGGMYPHAQGSSQLASAPIFDARQKKLGSLHAMIRSSAVAEVLHDGDLGETGAIYVVGRDGRTLFQGPGGERRSHLPSSVPEPGDTPSVEHYRASTGASVVGSATRFARFGWTVVVEEDYEEAFAPVVAVIRRILAINMGVVLLFGLAAYQFARSIVRPIRALSEGARRIADGETDVVVPLPAAQDEIEMLTRVFNEMSQRLRRNQAELERSRQDVEGANESLVANNQELQRVNEVLEQLSITDGLTKLHNHRFFQDHLQRELKRVRRTKEALSLILIDIDDFKKLNDLHGHAAGDSVLREVAVVMNGVLRETDMLARYGGEEFALLANQVDLEGACALGEKIRLAISQANFEAEGVDEPIGVTVSVGCSTYHGEAKALFGEADRALYQAKADGKDCVVGDRPS